jgi:hypothetical protein
MLIFALLLAQATVRVEQNSAAKGYASTLNYTGAGISCSVSGRKATCNVPGGGGGGGSPGGSSGNVQINSAGSFGAYTGTTCAYAVKSLDANGAATCTAAPSIPFPAGSASELQIRASGTAFGAYTGTGACAAGSFMTALDAFGAKTCAAPTIPADVSGASYWTRVAEPGLSNETALGALGTGIILNTTTTGVPTIYGGTSCTNQFPRSLNASGAATCAGVALTDLTATGTPSATTFLRGDNTWATPAGGGGAPTTATYITQTPDATLSAEQALSTLATGLLKNTTTTGVLTIAAAGTDYQAPLTLPLSIANGGTNSSATATAGGVGYGTGTAHAYSAAGTAGQVLISGGAGAPTWGNGCVTLGTATGATTTVGPVTWTGTYGTLIYEYIVAGYNGGTPVGRILMGAASISTTALTNGNSMSEGIAGTLTNALSIPGAPLAVTLSNIGRCGTMTVRGASGALKSYEIIGGNGTLSVSAARTLFRSAGTFSDLSTNLPIQRAQLTVYDTLTATAASAQTFTTGTRITVIGCP